MNSGDVMSRIVEIRDLKKSYEDGNIKALNGISLDIEEGEFVSIIGPSGSGKSTLLNMLGALDIADSGSIRVAGYDLKENKKLNVFRGDKIGFVFQLHNLIPNISVCENCWMKWDSRTRRISDLPSYLEESAKGWLLQEHWLTILP